MKTSYIKRDLKLIQLLRCLACILVVIFHISGNFSKGFNSPFLGNIFNFGGAGVDIFFVLSGFIITYSNIKHIDKKYNAVGFLKKRIIRIYPIYWVLLSFFLLMQIALPTFYNTHFLFSSENLLNTYLLLPEHNMVNGVSWTLTNELFFYLLFTISFFIPNKRYLVYLLFIYLTFLVIFPTLPFTGNTSNRALNMLFFPMNIEFLLGIIVVLYLDKFPQKWCLPILFIGIFLFIISAIFTNSSRVLFSTVYNRVVLFGMPSFLIIFSLVKYEFTHQISVPKIFLKLGDASYSIYLFHLPLVSAFFKIILKFQITNFYLILLLICGLLLIICYAGIFLFEKVETPLIKYLNKI